MNKIKEFNLLDFVITYLFSILPITFIIGKLIFEINIFFIIITFIFSLNKKKLIEVFDKKEFLIFLILVIYLQLNTIISENWEVSFIRNFFFFRFYLIIISFRYFFVHYNLTTKVLNIWILIIFITSFDVLYEFINGQNLLGFKSNYIHRISSFFDDELIVGSFIFSFTIPLFSYIYMKKKYTFSIIFLSISFIAIFLSGERSVFFKMIITLLLIFYLWDYKKHLKKYILLILFISLSLLFLTNINKFFKNQIDRYFFSITRNISNYEELSLRENLLETQYINQAVITYEILKKHPLFGVGNKNYFNSCKIYMSENDNKYCFTHPHQIYYEILSEHGIFGSFLIIFLILKLINLQKNKIKIASNKSKLYIYGLYLYLTLIPLLPSGSFLSSNISLLFWINYFFYTFYRDFLIKKEQI
jgi:O-antigen ligase